MREKSHDPPPDSAEPGRWGAVVTLSKKQRKEVWDKSGGKCWYCGRDLPEKGWHADHVEAILRATTYEPCGGNSYRLVQTGKMYRGENDHIENIVPACAPCNLFKTSHSLEFFRSELAVQVERARKSSVNFRMAERFGQIEVKSGPILFWFERRAVMSPALKTTVTVCSSCLQASCWQGLFYCDNYQSAGTVEKNKKELAILALEHPSYWEPENVD